ncbi:MarR family winged helix-turn-helix transcriptional regulator [Gordonia hankookensis]|uniref:Winged helix-turn-helix transcriptional regulator n=1 Tax=Gordonia hankookensis TaxID=589403 RepID=A0ABR7WBS7_9ACTN|nr:MarR family winged helix-turn-helix transcriptional regulator [Gordonia hankookensis]MBD1320260.1 winged helix-turn-helix transcriptional regulator [Gordonia hankookensis]NDZ95649.1 winged helix-turn-helix transcriptional regulator [Streptomyces sp. SID11726]NEB25896.1 winged helix-turn-helix transcriptional regulator [Streptomyces sp. SID6673]
MRADSGAADQALSSTELAIWRAVVKGGWGLLAEINTAMSAEGMSQADLRVLEALGDSRTRGISELAADVHMTVSTVSRQTARLVADGLVERVECGTDARHRYVRITECGLAARDRHVSVRNDLIRRLVVDRVTADEYQTLGEVFRKINGGLSDLPE